MAGHTARADAFAPSYLKGLRKQILASRYFAVHTLNRDFVSTRGFSVVFRRDSLDTVMRELPYLRPYLELALRPDCNAFYLNPLHMVSGSRVDPHIDRSLQSYCVHVDPPVAVSVLYVEVPPAMRGGDLVLAQGRKHLARITPTQSMLVVFDGHLTHSVTRVEGEGARLSLVCEQYQLTPEELERVPAFAIQTRAAGAAMGGRR
jgi:hypothetical protein